MTLNKKNIINFVRVIINIIHHFNQYLIIHYDTIIWLFFKDNKRKKSVHSTKFNMGKRK